MDEIIKNKLYLGDIFDANNEEKLDEFQISSIFCVAKGVTINNFSKKRKVYNFDIEDNYECDISLFFEEILNLIEKEDIVIVNCFAGISRSATIVIAYLMAKEKMNLHEAFLYVRKKRPRICPNLQFMKYLLTFEKKLFFKNSLTFETCRKLFYFT